MRKKSSKHQAHGKRPPGDAEQVGGTDQIALVRLRALKISGAVGVATSLVIPVSHFLWGPIVVITVAIYVRYFYLQFPRRMRKQKSIQRRFKLIFVAIISVSIVAVVVIHRYSAEVVLNSSGPELLLDATATTFVTGRSPIVTSHVNNVGMVTAYRIEVCAETIIEPASFEGPLKYGIPPPKAEKTIVQMLPPRIPATMVSTSKGMLLQDVSIEALTHKKALLFFFGRGQYLDRARKSYPITFCFLYDPDRSDRLMATCPKQYWPRENASSSECPPN